MKATLEVMSREQRQQFVDRIEVLEKVKAIFLIPQICMATTDQVADYFGVPVKTINGIYARNKEELDANGSVILSPTQVDALQMQNASSIGARGYRLFSVEDEVFTVNNNGTRFYPPRAILCIAMLLRDSAVAAEIRTQLLNLVDAAPLEMKIANVEAQEEVALRFAKAMMAGNTMSMAQAFTDMMALQNHTITTQASAISRLTSEKKTLSDEKEMLRDEKSQWETRAASLEQDNGALTDANVGLTRLNESLAASNRMLAEEAVVWDPQRVTNAIVRRIAKVIYGGKYGLAWNEFYRELMYQTGICVGQRGSSKKNASALSTIKEEEWPKVLRTLASLGCRYCIDVIDVTNEKVVEKYGLDHVDTEEGIIHNTGIVRSRRLAV